MHPVLCNKSMHCCTLHRWYLHSITVAKEEKFINLFRSTSTLYLLNVIVFFSVRFPRKFFPSTVFTFSKLQIIFYGITLTCCALLLFCQSNCTCQRRNGTWKLLALSRRRQWRILFTAINQKS